MCSGLRQSRATAVRDSGKKVEDCKNSMADCGCRQRDFFVARTLEAAIATRHEQLETTAAEISVVLLANKSAKPDVRGRDCRFNSAGQAH